MPGDADRPAAVSNAAFRVGEWAVEPDLNRLVAEDRTEKLEPKAMATLCRLAESRGQVVSREELLSAVWPGVVVSEDALTQVIVKLRRALGDTADSPTFIQTVSKKGYRLICPVAPPGVPRGDSPVEPMTRPVPGGGRRMRDVVAAAFLMLVAVTTALWILRESGSTPASESALVREADPDRMAYPTIAIRPFEAISQDPKELLLARAMAADIATDLSKVSGLWVVRVTSEVGPVTTETSSALLPVRYFVGGTVQRLEDRLRLQVHLTEAATGRQIWSERFDRASGTLFEIQDEIGPSILRSLPVRVSEAEKRRMARRYTRNLEAYEAFQQGQVSLHVRRKAENEEARELFRRAIEQDAAFARAYAGLAMTYVADFRNQWVADVEASLDRAFELARTVNQIDPDIPETYWLLAFVHVHRHQHDEALRHIETSLRLSPSFADGYATKGGIYTSTGRAAEAVPLLRLAMRLHPDSGYLYFMLLGRAYLFLGDLEQARVNLVQALSRNPEFLDARVYLAVALVESGDRPAAAWEAEEIRSLRPDFAARRWLETNPTADVPTRTRLVRVLGELGL